MRYVMNKVFSGCMQALFGLVGNPVTGQMSHSKVWANIAAAVLTYKFMQQSEPLEWTWYAYGGMVGGYGLAKRVIAGVQQVAQNKKDNRDEDNGAI